MTITVRQPICIVLDSAVPGVRPAGRINHINDVVEDNLDENGVVFACRTPEHADKVAELCTHLWERGTSTVLLRMLPWQAWPHHPVSSVVDLDDAELWHSFVLMFAYSFGRPAAEFTIDELVPWRSGTRVTHLRGDGRFGDLLPELRQHLRAAPETRTLIAPPPSETENWPGQWDEAIDSGEFLTSRLRQDPWTEVLAFTRATEMPDTRHPHPVEPEWLLPDMRPFHGSLRPPHDLRSTAAALAEAHLAHDSWELTLQAVAACAHYDAAQLADRVLDLLGDRDEPLDPHHDKLCRMATDAA